MGAFMLYALVISRTTSHSVALSIVTLAVLLQGLINIWTWIDSKRHRETADADSIPSKYAFLAGGYLFTIVGILFLLIPAIFGSLPPQLTGQIAFWMGALTFLLSGLAMLVVFCRHRPSSKPAEELRGLRRR